MNINPGLIGTKIGKTQIFLDDGEVRRVTAIQAGPCVVIGKRTPDKDGYSALQLGMGKKRDKLVNKAQAKAYANAKVEAPEVVREFRVAPELLERFSVGQTINAADIFTEGQFVDVSGTSKGRGFTGVMKRHNFSGAGTVGHGTHEYKRHGGSIGMNMTPGRTLRGRKMPGQYGNNRATVINLKVARVLGDQSVLLVEGGVPGPNNGVVTIKGAVKKPAVALPEPPAPPEPEGDGEQTAEQPTEA